VHLVDFHHKITNMLFVSSSKSTVFTNQ